MRQFAPWVLVLVSAAAAVGAYLQALHYLFISDDTVNITENAKLLSLHFSDLWRLFIEPYNRNSEFLPLRELSYWIDFTLFGLKSSVFRIDNIILYLLCLPLTYGTTLRLWRYLRPADDSASLAAAAVTALFALHPALVESVVWITGRKYVLANLFAMLALWFAVSAKGERSFSVRHSVAALIAVVAMMLSKTSYVAVAPIIALLWLMFWFDIPAIDRRRSQLLWPLSALLLACLVVMFTFAIGKDYIKVSGGGIPDIGIEAAIRSLAVLGWMARLSVSPESRHFFYPALDDPYLYVMVLLGILVVLAAGIVIILRKRSLESFAVVAFLLLCVPYIQLVSFTPPSIVSDRYLALAAWPAMILLVSLAWRMGPILRTILLIVIALSWTFQTIQRPRDWISLGALLDSDIWAYPGYYLPAAHKIVYVELKNGLRKDALETANTISDQVDRDIMIKLVNVDYVVKVKTSTTGNPQEAMDSLWDLEQSFNLPAQAKWNPAIKNFWSTTATALIVEWEYLATQFPDAAPVRFNAGLWLLKVHKYKEAVDHLRAAAESQSLPESARGTAYKNLGLALIGAGDAAAAEAPLRAALEQSPPDFRAYCALADVYKRTGRIEEAARAEVDCRSRAPAEGMAQ